MNNQPPSYIPPSAPPRRGPNCWLVGGLTCLGIVLLVIIAIIVGTASFMHSTTGKKFAGIFGSAMQLPDCENNMKTIREAIVRYHEHTGSYPDNLSDLTPTYLPNAQILHCGLDTNKDPAHVSYIYTKPTSSSTDSSTLLTLHWIMKLDVGQQSQTTDTTIVLTLGGQILQQQSHTQATQSGGTP